ncbi:hypothetical protein [Nostoc sp. DedSLP04]|uniref:hypothetical protein n=1 Tax=Nostoc sp. DedSLP04 TaxID=3075401 RepID=UPI002AD58AFD|nr:hypothetical protein [Nostoc sp. DedSLP04]MDZ8032955.1 hypothetical protein [Nostoc sp. DedSLP04]
MKIVVEDKALLPLALKVKQGMEIHKYIPFKDMDVTELKKWLNSCYDLRPDIFLKELANFTNLIRLEN